MSEQNNTAEKTMTIPGTFQQTFTWSTEKNGDKKQAIVTFDLTDLTADDILAYAIDSLVIKLQGQLRRTFGTENWKAPKTEKVGEGDGAYVREVYEVKAAKPGVRANADPKKAEAKAMAKVVTESGLTLEQIKALVEAAKMATIAKGLETKNENEPEGDNEGEEQHEDEQA